MADIAHAIPSSLPRPEHCAHHRGGPAGDGAVSVIPSAGPNDRHGRSETAPLLHRERIADRHFDRWWWRVLNRLGTRATESRRQTRVCSYDRAGLGWSDSGPAEETVEETVSDLHDLLHASGEKGPFILVGASIGGIFIQAYQRAFPEDVAGLVFSKAPIASGLREKTKVD